MILRRPCLLPFSSFFFWPGICLLFFLMYFSASVFLRQSFEAESSSQDVERLLGEPRHWVSWELYRYCASPFQACWQIPQQSHSMLSSSFICSCCDRTALSKARKAKQRTILIYACPFWAGRSTQVARSISEAIPGSECNLTQKALQIPSHGPASFYTLTMWWFRARAAQILTSYGKQGITREEEMLLKKIF